MTSGCEADQRPSLLLLCLSTRSPILCTNYHGHKRRHCNDIYFRSSPGSFAHRLLRQIKSVLVLFPLFPGAETRLSPRIAIWYSSRSHTAKSRTPTPLVTKVRTRADTCILGRCCCCRCWMHRERPSGYMCPTDLTSRWRRRRHRRSLWCKWGARRALAAASCTNWSWQSRWSRALRFGLRWSWWRSHRLWEPRRKLFHSRKWPSNRETSPAFM